jgi:putative CocE/NonD family hydrolase
VTSFVLGDGHYATQADWPDPRLFPTRLYVNAGNTLTPAKPGASTSSLSDTFLQNPVSGICTQSTSQWSAGLLSAAPCTTDNRLDEATDGVQYTTGPLSQNFRFSGPALADVWVTTTSSDAVISVRVNDVAPDGSVTELTDGWLAASYRALDPTRSRYVGGQLLQPWHPFTKESVIPVAPGQPTELQIEVFPTNAVIKAGHQLRLSIGPSDFPHAVPPVGQLVNTLGGLVTVLHDPAHPSYVALPALTCKTGCKPLPVPNLRRG